MLRDPRYDRSRLLEEAARAISRRRTARAIALYRWVLAIEPHNADIHLRLAPLLAQRRESFDAWLCFQAAARAFARGGRPDRALAIYRQAAAVLPREVQVWRAIARIEQRAGRTRVAVETLVEGSRALRRGRLRPQAVHLLRLARELEPWHFEAVHELARLLARSQQREEARILLRGLSHRCGGRRLRCVRAQQLLLSPTPGNLWGWLTAALRSAPEPLSAADERPSVVPLRAGRLARVR